MDTADLVFDALRYNIVRDEEGVFYYNRDGLLHRVGGPAIEWADGSKEWYINGLLHRADGPAREWADGTKEWYINGKRHREDGPAIEWAKGTKSWWVNGKRLTEKQFFQWRKDNGYC